MNQSPSSPLSGEWKSVAMPPLLKENELQLWRIVLDDPAGILPTCTSILSPEEQDRANRRRIGQVRNQFVLARACLRILLGHQLLISPRDVPIVADFHGKPGTPGLNGKKVSYNIAHSQDTILIALCRQGSVGVDVEHIDRAVDIMEIAQEAFNQNETMKLAAVEDPDYRRLAFYRCWTQKEAVVKADGRGLSLLLSTFEVPIHSTRFTPVLISRDSGGQGRLYFVTEIPLGRKGMVGALALESANYQINMLDFPSTLWE
jgi:4'-phosphopantetheinyl transferase